jgi:hypothetical protein
MKITAIRFTVLVLVLSGLFLTGCSKNEGVPESELGHIDIILDTATFNALARDTFMTTYFAYTFKDTTLYGLSFSYDFFVMGQENFLHISQERSFWQGQAGGMGFVYQTKKPDMKDSIHAAWKKFTPFALEDNVSNGQGYSLIEVLPVLNWQNITTPRIVPYLSTYSTESYKTWGFTEHDMKVGVGMKSFLFRSFGASISNTLFKSIAELDITATEREKELLESALFAAGYKESGGVYKHPVSAAVKITVNEQEPFKRFNKMKIMLSRNVQPMEKVFNRLKVTFDKDVCWFILD